MFYAFGPPPRDEPPEDHLDPPPCVESLRLRVLAPPGTPECVQEVLLEHLDQANFRTLLSRAASGVLRELGLTDCAVEIE